MAKGGSPAPQIVQPPPPTITQLPAPNVSQNAEDLFKAQLLYNPQLTAQAAQLQERYGPQLAQSQTNVQTQQAPQLAQSQYDLQRQYGPLYRALYTQLFPTQVQGQETLAQQALQRLQSPQGLSPEQQAAQDFIRNREQYRLIQGIRSQANLGGNLYSGHRQLQEQEALAELARQYSQQDIALQQQQRAQALQELIASSQVVFPQVQQPGVSQVGAAQFGHGVTPSPDALMQAIQQATFVQPSVINFPQSQPGFWSGGAAGIGPAIGGISAALLASALAQGSSCHVAETLYGRHDPRTILARWYVLTHESGFLTLYRRHSRAWAAWLTRLPFLKPLAKPIWDRMWRRMLRRL